MTPEPDHAKRKSTDLKDRSFVPIALGLAVLLAAALWQFYSLAWGDGLGGPSSARGPSKEQPDGRT